MADTQALITASGLILLLMSFTYVGVTGHDPNYYCMEGKTKAYCTSVSSTARTCYTLPAKTGGKTCAGAWKEIPAYPEQRYGRRWVCDYKGCVEI